MILLVSSLVLSIIGIVLAEFEIFSLSGILAFSILYIVLLAIVHNPVSTVQDLLHRTTDSELRTPDSRPQAFLICILLIVLGLGSFSFEYILGGRDPGVYMNAGIHLAHTGSLVSHDTLLASMDPSQQELFYDADYYNYSKYPGFFAEGSTIIPQFLPLSSVWIGFFYLMFGLKGALWTNTFFGVLATLAVYFVGKRLFHPIVGLISALLLTLNATQIWHMRNPSPEILLQFLIFAGIYAYDRYQREAVGWLGVVSAMAFGLTFLAKPLAFLLLLPIGLYLYGKTLRAYTSLDTYFVLPFLLCLSYTAFHIYYTHSSYILGHLERFKGNWFLVPLVVIISILFWLNPRVWRYGSVGAREYGGMEVCEYGSRKEDLSAPTHPHTHTPTLAYLSTLRSILIILLCALGLYSYFVRPLLAQNVYHTEMNRLDRDYAMDATVHLGWYLSPVVVFLGIVGACLFIYKRMDRVNLLFLLIGFVYSFFVLKGTQDAWDHIWIMRRNVPVVIPVFLLFTTYTLWYLYHSDFSIFRSVPKLPKFISLSLLGFLLCYLLFVSWPLVTHREYRGIISFMDQLSELIPDDSIFVLDTFDVSLRIAPPLEYIYRKNVLVFYQNTLENYQKFIKLAHQWIQEGRKIYFVTPLIQGLEPFKKLSFSVPELEHAIGHLPGKVNDLRSDVYVYRLTENDGIDKHLLKLGINDFGLIEGFYHIEDLPDKGGKYRWTKGKARILIPGADEVRIRLREWRPDFLLKGKVEVFVENTLITVLQPTREFQDYEVTIPPNLVRDPLTLTLVTPTWNPKVAIKASEDARDLGVMIEEVEVKK
jgi:hypothetical protein